MSTKNPPTLSTPSTSERHHHAPVGNRRAISNSSRPAGNARNTPPHSGDSGGSRLRVTTYVLPHATGAIAVMRTHRHHLSSTEEIISHQEDKHHWQRYHERMPQPDPVDDLPPDRVDDIQQEWRRERPDVDPSPQGVIGRLHRVALKLTERLVTVYREFDLTEGEFDVLATLRRAGAPYERDAGHLADHTLVTTGGLTKRVDRLEARGLVERHVGVTDARKRLVRLTPAGLDLIDRAFTAHMANEHRLLADLGPDDTAALEPILTRWLARLDAR